MYLISYKMEECLNSKIKDLEKDKERLDRLVKSDEMKQGLETELSNLREESDAKMLKVGISFVIKLNRILCWRVMFYLAICFIRRFTTFE